MTDEGHIKMREVYEKESGKRWVENPYTHGEVGYASWDYQLWLEDKVDALEKAIIEKNKFLSVFKQINDADGQI